MCTSYLKVNEEMFIINKAEAHSLWPEPRSHVSERADLQFHSGLDNKSTFMLSDKLFNRISSLIFQKEQKSS